jgi:plastocyanin
VTGLIGSPIASTGIATPGNPANLIFSSQNPASGAPSSLATLAVKARDAHGNGVAGIRIDWATTAGGGLVSPGVDTTNTQGIATTSHTLSDSTRPDSVTATSTPGLSGSPVSFETTIVIATTVAISIDDDTFTPGTDTVAVGDTVQWTNNGGLQHTVTSGNGSPTVYNSGTLNPTSTFTHVYTAVGTYPYYCQFHGTASGTGMHGVIVVK